MADLANTQAAAKAVGLSKWYLYRHHKQLPGAYRAGKALRWDVEELKRWMRNQAQAKHQG